MTELMRIVDADNSSRPFGVLLFGGFALLWAWGWAMGVRFVPGESSRMAQGVLVAIGVLGFVAIVVFCSRQRTTLLTEGEIVIEDRWLFLFSTRKVLPLCDVGNVTCVESPGMLTSTAWLLVMESKRGRSFTLSSCKDRGVITKQCEAIQEAVSVRCASREAHPHVGDGGET